MVLGMIQRMAVSCRGGGRKNVLFKLSGLMLKHVLTQIKGNHGWMVLIVQNVDLEIRIFTWKINIILSDQPKPINWFS